MKPVVHPLHGCTKTPLAHYLKGLAVLRLVAEQADPAARGFWKDDTFYLVTSLDKTSLEAFFLEQYKPTPILAPWNGGSGFYPKDAKAGIDSIANSNAARFVPYREAIRDVFKLLEKYPDPKKDKALLLHECKATWALGLFDWLGAAVVVLAQDDLKYPALLGTGGNDGRLDFSNNQMQRLVELLDPETGAPAASARQLLQVALFGGIGKGLYRDKAIGQFFPGSAGGANSVAGYSGDSLINPWDYVLMLEGALLFQVAAVRRLDGQGLPQAAAPFAVRAQGSGYASACSQDESARGEQWMPLWNRPATLKEVQALFAEGRLQSGQARARKALDAARAVARMGASRGVTEFVRFGYIERNGMSNLAVPLGTWPVREIQHVHLLDEIDEWVDTLRRASGRKTAPEALGRAVRQIEGAMLEVCQAESTERWGQLLMHLSQTEDMLAVRSKATQEFGLRPIPDLSAAWFDAANDKSAEVVLAIAIASQIGPDDFLGPLDKQVGPLRAHCIPLDRASNWHRFAAIKDPRVVWSGRDLITDLGRVAMRRVIEGKQRGLPGFPLKGQCFARVDDIAGFLEGRVDEQRVAALARAFMAINFRRERPVVPSSQGRPLPTDALLRLTGYALFRLIYLPTPLTDFHPPVDPAPLRLLLADRLHDAMEMALVRLKVYGARPKLRAIVGGSRFALRLAASLAIPAHPRDLQSLLNLISKPISKMLDPDDEVSNIESKASSLKPPATKESAHVD